MREICLHVVGEGPLCMCKSKPFSLAKLGRIDGCDGEAFDLLEHETVKAVAIPGNKK